MKKYLINIEEALANTNFRKVLYADKYSQLVLMHLLPHEEIDRKTMEARQLLADRESEKI